MHISEHGCAVACWVHVYELYELHVGVSHICEPPKVTSWVGVWSRPGFMHSGAMLPCPSLATSTCSQNPTDHSKFYPPPCSEDSRLALSCISSRDADRGVIDGPLPNPTPFHPWSLSFPNCRLSPNFLGHLPGEQIALFKSLYIVSKSPLVPSDLCSACLTPLSSGWTPALSSDPLG